MKRKFPFKNKIQTALKKSSALRDRQLMHPEREWAIGLAVAAILLISAVSLAVFTYIKNQAVSVEAEPDTTESVIYRQSVVAEVLKIMKDRDARVNTATETKAPVVIEEPPATIEETVIATTSDTIAPTLISQ